MKASQDNAEGYFMVMTGQNALIGTCEEELGRHEIRPREEQLQDDGCGETDQPRTR